MTTIAVKVDREQGIIQIAADNQTTSYGNSNEQSGQALAEGFKLLELSNGWIFAFAGESGEITLFSRAARAWVEKPRTPLEGPDFLRSKVDFLVDFLKDCYSQYIGNPGYTFESLLMLAICRDEAYQITDRYAVAEVKNFMALGSGKSYALAAMYLGFDAVTAVKCAAEFDLFTDDRVSSREVKTTGGEKADGFAWKQTTSGTRFERA